MICTICNNTDINQYIICECNNIFCNECVKKLIELSAQSAHPSSGLSAQSAHSQSGLSADKKNDEFLVSCPVCSKELEIPPSLFKHYIEFNNKFLADKIKIEIKSEQIKEDRLTILTHKIENMLCPSCPNCGNVFYDNDACRNVQCNKCKIHFCAYCCEYKSYQHNDIYKHMGNCEASSTKDVYSDFEIYKRDQNEYLKKKTKEYINNLEDEIKNELKKNPLIKELFKFVPIKNIKNIKTEENVLEYNYQYYINYMNNMNDNIFLNQQKKNNIMGVYSRSKIYQPGKNNFTAKNKSKQIIDFQKNKNVQSFF